MENDENTVSYTAAELDEMLARGEDKTNWDRLRSMTEEELEASIDWEEEGEWDLDSARGDIPGPQQQIIFWVDEDIVAWFRSEVEGTGLGYKTRMNEVLREYMEGRQKRPESVEAGSARRAG
jgi:uncharacterized protein (DUF4415 family)